MDSWNLMVSKRVNVRVRGKRNGKFVMNKKSKKEREVGRYVKSELK
ncbi:hypothetical protein EDD76_11859 [Kineothrix alysoides]|uniref:Uncharacterized protein n=1 Tax=Kineothrix alysoides TaxID=1469948 RepID=A0A4R1QM71_9FIRM|nr:hypothetical protein [Kineothrix alysoides]TCL54818.1 hypothetical protein EDD76_11859 [Kineothrix alysoides]